MCESDADLCIGIPRFIQNHMIRALETGVDDKLRSTLVQRRQTLHLKTAVWIDRLGG